MPLGSNLSSFLHKNLGNNRDKRSESWDAMAKTDKLEFTNVLRIICKGKKGEKYHNCIWLPRVKQIATGERYKKGREQVMVWRPQGTHSQGLFDLEAVISKGKPNVTQSLCLKLNKQLSSL